MEKESFEDPAVASLLNQNFICIKVDREERPDIDSVYMSACQAMHGQGGWPLTIIMTSEQKPFFAATYIPKNDKYHVKGLMKLLPEIKKQWDSYRNELLSYSDKASLFLQEQALNINRRQEPSEDLLKTAAVILQNNADLKNGGFGFAPKFPTPHNLLFLLRYSVLEKDTVSLAITEKTLEQMYRGGIFDHIGGGFSRYSTDDKWLIPHFEKMLYDNALLTYTYLEAYQLTGKELYKKISVKILNYVTRELTDSEGGFFCGQDADSDGIEGKYYVWTPAEIIKLLGAEHGNLFNNWFQLTPNGNFEGKSIPNLLSNPDFTNSNPAVETLLLPLYEYRKKRTTLHKDDKVLTSWNGLMISAFAKAYRILNNPEYLQTAEKAQLFISSKLTDKNNRLILRWRDKEAAGSGQLDDYAFYSFGLLELYEATLCIDYLDQAIAIADQMVTYFYDTKSGGFYLYAKDSEQLITRPKEIYDGAMPSGNSVAAMVLLKLAKLTGELKWEKLASDQQNFITGTIYESPSSYSFSLLSIMNYLYPSKELIAVLHNEEMTGGLLKILNQHSSENITVLAKTPENAMQLEKIAPFTKNYPFPETGDAFYICENHACSAPVFSLNELKL